MALLKMEPRWSQLWPAQRSPSSQSSLGVHMGLATMACAAEPMGKFNLLSVISPVFFRVNLVIFWDKLF